MSNRSLHLYQLMALISGFFTFFCVNAGALTEFAGGRLSVNAQSLYTYQSNVFANSSKQDDQSITFRPGLSYTREKGLIHMQSNFAINTMTFQEFDEQDVANFQSGITFSFPHESGNPLSAILRGGFNQTSTADETVGDRVTSNNISLGAQASYRVNEKYSVNGSLTFDHQSFDGAALVDQSTFSTGAGISYRYSSKLDLAANYRFRFTDVDAAATAATSKDHAFYFGAVGQVLPKTTASIGLGAQFRDYENNNLYQDKWAPFAIIDLSWAARPSLTVSLNGQHDFATTAANETLSRTKLSMGASFKYLEKTTVSASIFAENTNYEDPVVREDEAWGIGAGINREINEYITIFANANYSDRDSTDAFSTFRQHTVTIGISTSY